MIKSLLSVSEWIVTLLIIMGFLTTNEAIVLFGCIWNGLISVYLRKSYVSGYIFVGIFCVYILMFKETI